jgi:hypothetical protein
MSLESQLATEPLEARLAEELEERTEFCDWLSCCTSCCGGSTTSCTTGPSSAGTTCTTSPSKGW